MTYIPQPGTVPHRVINWLKLQPVGSEYPSAVLAEELGVQQANIGPCLQVPIRHGAITARKEGRLMMFGLGNGVPTCSAPDFELDEPLEADKGIIVDRELKARAVQPLIKAVTAPLAQQPRAAKEPRKEATGIRVPVFLQEDAPRTEPDIAAAVTDWDKHYTAPIETQPATAKPFRVGEFSDGTLVIERGAYDRYELTPAESKVLMDFIFESARVGA